MKNYLLKTMLGSLLLVACFALSVQTATAQQTGSSSVTIRLNPIPKGTIVSTPGNGVLDNGTYYICNGGSQLFHMTNITPTGAIIDVAKGTQGWEASAGGAVTTVTSGTATVQFTNTGTTASSVTITGYLTKDNTPAPACEGSATYNMVVIPTQVLDIVLNGSTYTDGNSVTLCENTTGTSYNLSATTATFASFASWSFTAANPSLLTATAGSGSATTIYFENSSTLTQSGTLTLSYNNVNENGTTICSQTTEIVVNIVPSAEVTTIMVDGAVVATSDTYAMSTCSANTHSFGVTMSDGSAFTSWSFTSGSASITVTDLGSGSYSFVNTGTTAGTVSFSANYTNTDCGDGTLDGVIVVTVYPEIKVILTPIDECAVTLDDTQTIAVTVTVTGGSDESAGYTGTWAAGNGTQTGTFTIPAGSTSTTFNVVAPTDGSYFNVWVTAVTDGEAGCTFTGTTP